MHDDIILHTYALSPYGRTAALTAAEKEVSFTVRLVDPRAPEHRRRHPFGRVPVLQHGDVWVYETMAIAHYIDGAFLGPELVPHALTPRVEMLRWISVVNGYVFPTSKALLFERAEAFRRGETVDEARLAELGRDLADQTAVIEQALAAQPFLVGSHLSLADLFLLPHLHYAATLPEGEAALAAAPATREWLLRMVARPSFAHTDPSAMTRAASAA